MTEPHPPLRKLTTEGAAEEELKRTTPSNAELLQLADRFPAPIDAEDDQ